MELKSKYTFRQLVFLYTDLNQKERIVLAVEFRAGGTVLYYLGCGETQSWHFEEEISISKNINKAMGLS